MKKQIALIFLLFSIFSGYAQSDIKKGLDAITDEAVKGQLGFLASDWTEGRAFGTKGAYLASDYIASVFKVYGIKPFGDIIESSSAGSEQQNGNSQNFERSYFQNFSMLEYSAGDEQFFSVINNSSESKINFNYKTDFSVFSGTVGQTAEAPVVFAGYGFQDDKGMYDDLDNIDVEDKIVVIITGFPGHKDPSSAAFKKFAPEGSRGKYRIERNKWKKLENEGAIAIVRLSTDIDPAFYWASNKVYPAKGKYFESDEPFPTYYDTRAALPGDTLNQGIPVFLVTERAGNYILEGTGINIEEFERNSADKMITASRDISDKTISFHTTVNSKITKVRNVLGYIEGKNKDEYIVVGGHYDHVGKYNGWIWNGADDNASGTVGVMTIAKAFMATGKKPEKSVIFAAWTAEEKGLWGSRYFVNEANKSELDILLNLNYDMIARDSKDDSLMNKASMGYTKANAGIEKLTKQNIEKYGINLDVKYNPVKNPRGGSDFSSFAERDIPVFYFMAAMHPDYHLPSDELDKINWEKMINIIKIGFLNTWEFANSDKYLNKEELP